MSRHYLLYGSERYALAILRPLQAAIRARGDVAAWFFDGPGGEELHADEWRVAGTEQVEAFTNGRFVVEDLCDFDCGPVLSALEANQGFSGSDLFDNALREESIFVVRD